jgi:aryl-alcohol dehydrogenase-like predicted oxidoreductase
MSDSDAEEASIASPSMRYTMFGKTGLRVSELCLGTMTFGEQWGWGAAREACARMVDAFEEAGGNFVDTANNYTGGSSETLVGELLDGRRDRFVLATKYTVQTEPDPNSAGNHRKSLLRSLDRSLERLKTDYVDILWVHARDTLTPVEEVMRALDDQVRLGKVLYVGVSDWPAWEVAQATTLAELRGWSPFIGLQIEYSMLERTVERELLPMARGLDLGVTAWSPLAGGRLTGKYLSGGEESEGRLAVMGRDGSDVRADAIVREVVAVAEEIGASPPQVALAWLREQPGAVVPIVGARHEEQLRDNLASVDVRLEGPVRERLDRASAVELGFPGDFLRGEPMPKAIIYGESWKDVEDRRFTVRRVPADDPDLLAHDSART